MADKLPNEKGRAYDGQCLDMYLDGEEGAVVQVETKRVGRNATLWISVNGVTVLRVGGVRKVEFYKP